MDKPTFRLPSCIRHFFGRNRWWCRKCQAEVARQFEEVYDAFWRSNHRYNKLADHWLECSVCGATGAPDSTPCAHF